MTNLQKQIKYGECRQAQYLAEQLPSKSVSVWLCKGFNKKEDGGAFARWHITSTDINEESVPKLKTIYGRQFKFAIAFHGWAAIPFALEDQSQRQVIQIV